MFVDIITTQRFRENLPLYGPTCARRGGAGRGGRDQLACVAMVTAAAAVLQCCSNTE